MRDSTVKCQAALRHVNNQRALPLDDVDIIARVKPGALRDITSNHYTAYICSTFTCTTFGQHIFRIREGSFQENYVIWSIIFYLNL